MKCPVDNEILQMTERSGIEIDYCPKCRGVWLDRGELDKMLDKGAATVKVDNKGREKYFDKDDIDDDNYYGHSQSNNYSHKRKRREGFLGDIFDF